MPSQIWWEHLDLRVKSLSAALPGLMDPFAKSVLTYRYHGALLPNFLQDLYLSVERRREVWILLFVLAAENIPLAPIHNPLLMRWSHSI